MATCRIDIKRGGIDEAAAAALGVGRRKALDEARASVRLDGGTQVAPSAEGGRSAGRGASSREADGSRTFWRFAGDALTARG